MICNVSAVERDGFAPALDAKGLLPAEPGKGSLILGIVTNGTMAGVLLNEMMTGALLDGTKVGNKRLTLPQAHFHLEIWISVPPVVRSGSNG